MMSRAPRLFVLDFDLRLINMHTGVCERTVACNTHKRICPVHVSPWTPPLTSAMDLDEAWFLLIKNGALLKINKCNGSCVLLDSRPCSDALVLPNKDIVLVASLSDRSMLSHTGICGQHVSCAIEICVIDACSSKKIQRKIPVRTHKKILAWNADGVHPMGFAVFFENKPYIYVFEYTQHTYRERYMDLKQSHTSTIKYDETVFRLPNGDFGIASDRRCVIVDHTDASTKRKVNLTYTHPDFPGSIRWIKPRSPALCLGNNTVLLWDAHAVTTWDAHLETHRVPYVCRDGHILLVYPCSRRSCVLLIESKREIILNIHTGSVLYQTHALSSSSARIKTPNGVWLVWP